MMSVISFSERKKKSAHQLGWRENVLEGSDHLQYAPPQGVPAVGIDLGTTNTVVSIYEEGADAPRALSYEGSYLVPSLVAWDKEAQHVRVGRAAERFVESHPAEVIRSSKRSMGESQEFFRSFGREFRAEDAATEILKHVAAHEELQKLREEFNGLWTVITVPAHFDDAARRATLEAAHHAELYVLRIINEPTAAALAYSFLQTEDASDTSDEENLVVFDFGGGTFDVSVVHREGLVFKVLASEGDVRLGGDDVDEILADRLAACLQPPLLAKRARHDAEVKKLLHARAVEVKKELGFHGEVDLDVALGSGRLQGKIERHDFEEWIAPLIERTTQLTEQAIHQARRRAHQISRILLVGGSTRLPLVRKVLESYFVSCQVDNRLEPDLAVSWGAALQGAIILGTAPELVLVDVCNHSLGIGVVDDSESIAQHFRAVQKEFGLSGDLNEKQLREALGVRIADFNRELQKLLRVAPIIRRNSALPACTSEFFSTLYENQPAVHVIVAQGEEETVGENRLIGSFLFELKQPCPKGTKCEIQLTYDANGMVQIFARQLGTDNEAQARFDSRTGTVERWQKHASSAKSASRNPAASGRSAPVIPLKFGKVDEKMETDDGLRQEEEFRPEQFILNAIIARGRRLMKKNNLSVESEANLQSLMSTYHGLLSSALAGEDNDEELEEVEERLIELLERLESAD